MHPANTINHRSARFRLPAVLEIFSDASSLERFLPRLFVLYALTIGGLIAWLTPPFQNPDEAGHFMRATMIAAGQLVAHPISDGWSGGRLDAAIAPVFKPFENTPGHPERRLDPAAVRAVATIKWGQPAREFPIWGTVMYSPVAYLPAAAAIRLSQLADLTILASLDVARIFNLLSATLIGYLALLLMPGARAFLFTALTLPMSLAMFGAVSHDGFLIAGAALATATARREHIGLLIVSAILIAAIGAGRPVYATLAVLLLQRRPLQLRRLSLFLLALLAISAWWLFGAAPWTDFPRSDIKVSAHDQLDRLLTNPTLVITIAVETLRTHAVGYAVMTIGVLGSVDTLLPSPYYIAAALVLLLALAADVGTTSLQAPASRDRALALLAMLFAIASIFLAQYLSWTELGSHIVKGVQGRYFLPLMPLALVSTVASAPLLRIPRAVTIASCAAFPVLTAAVVPLAIEARYSLTLD